MPFFIIPLTGLITGALGFWMGGGVSGLSSIIKLGVFGALGHWLYTNRRKFKKWIA